MDQKTLMYMLFGYILGSVPWALIVGELFYDTDNREHGSHNLGATNAGRVLGKKNFYIVTLLDASKSLIIYFLLQKTGYHNALLAAAAAIVGHCYPIFSHFKGGKGVSTSAGLLLAVSLGSLSDFLIQFMIPFLVLVIIAVSTKYVSLASMTAYITAAAIMWLYNDDLITKITFTVLCIFVIYRHRENIQRLINHKENKVSFL